MFACVWMAMFCSYNLRSISSSATAVIKVTPIYAEEMDGGIVRTDETGM